MYQQFSKFYSIVNNTSDTRLQWISNELQNDVL